jgi:hypothetical protein
LVEIPLCRNTYYIQDAISIYDSFLLKYNQGVYLDEISNILLISAGVYHRITFKVYTYMYTYSLLATGALLSRSYTISQPTSKLPKSLLLLEPSCPQQLILKTAMAVPSPESPSPQQASKPPGVLAISMDASMAHKEGHCGLFLPPEICILNDPAIGFSERYEF